MNLQQKLAQLKLPMMSQQLDRILSEAAAKELSLGQALEWLTDLELESRNSHAMERRFRFSKLQAKHMIDSFQFTHHNSTVKMKPRLLHLLDLEFVKNGTNLVVIGIPVSGKRESLKPLAGGRVRQMCAWSLPPPWTCSTTCSPRRSITRWSANFAPTPTRYCS